VSDTTFAVGQHVYLRGCRVGEPGRVIRLERGRIIVDWADLSVTGRHSPASLMLAGSASESPPSRPAQHNSSAPSIHSTYAGREFSERENLVQPTPNLYPTQEAFQWQR